MQRFHYENRKQHLQLELWDLTVSLSAIFFQLLEECIKKYGFLSNRIFNVDETGITTVAKSLGKILATKGRKQVGSLSSSERGQLLTVEICMSADGSYMPPMFIFPRKRMKVELMDGTPPNSWGECNQSGWITKDLFLKWLKRFIEWSSATKDQPVLLLLDGHASHVKSLEVIDVARANGVVMLCFPPHCTHRLQPLDVTFMKPLSSYYGDEVKKWLRQHPGRTVTHYQVGQLFGRAYLRAATMLVAINGFQTTGIWPVNSNVFEDHDFLPCQTTDMPNGEERLLLDETICVDPYSVPPGSSTTAADPLMLSPNPVSETNQSTMSTPHSVNPIPMGALLSSPEPDLTNNDAPTSSTSFQKFSPSHIVAVPKAPVKKRVSKRRGKTAIITSSPYKAQLEAESTKSKPLVMKKKKASTKKKTTRKEESSESEEDEECLYCGHLYSQSTEGWISCRSCGKWAHCSCAGEDDVDDESSHICSSCNPV
ncbi:uncharacterized protein LOC129950719 [Eupeodes corollae]|uniref:uncharacterized protein LOC129950719 n=1 Tax=Eupeodes corollae TaxID=290404 RepID=UPI002492D713|nr:uncharacterized protein LOC129950719 [Eupeodes corollae]